MAVPGWDELGLSIQRLAARFEADVLVLLKNLVNCSQLRQALVQQDSVYASGRKTSLIRPNRPHGIVQPSPLKGVLGLG